MDIDKGKQKEGVIQDEDILLYKPYNISSKESWPNILELMFIQKEVNNLEKALKILQSPVKITPFYPPP